MEELTGLFCTLNSIVLYVTTEALYKIKSRNNFEQCTLTKRYPNYNRPLPILVLTNSYCHSCLKIHNES